MKNAAQPMIVRRFFSNKQSQSLLSFQFKFSVVNFVVITYNL